MILNLGNLPRTIWGLDERERPWWGDQRRLPGELGPRVRRTGAMVDAVKTLAVRGAPAIGGGGGGGDAGGLRVFRGHGRRGYAEEGMEDVEDGGFDRRLKSAAVRDRRGAADGGQLVLGARRAQEAARRPALPARQRQKRLERFTSIAGGPYCRRRGGEPPHWGSWNRVAARACRNGRGRTAQHLTHCNAAVWRTAFFMARPSVSFMRLHKKDSSTAFFRRTRRAR